MSLIAQALCVVAQNIVKGRTWAGDDVLLQPVYPIEEVLKEGRDPAPVIAVYAEHAKYDVEGRASQGRKTRVEMKFIVYNAPGVNRITVRPDSNSTDEVEDALIIDVDTEKAGLTLNVVARQIDAALHADVSLWADCWRKMVVTIEDREVRYILIEIENGVKIPAAEIGYTLSTIPDPDFGAPMTAAWVLFDTALKSTAEGAVLAQVFALLITEPAGLPGWKQFRDNFALSSAGMAATGLGPYAGVTTSDGDIPPFTGHTVTPQSGPVED